MPQVPATVYYAEPALCQQRQILVNPNTTVAAVRRNIYQSFKDHLFKAFDGSELDSAKLLHPNSDSVIIATDQRGFDAFDVPDAVVTLTASDRLYAIVPPPERGTVSSDSASLAACTTNRLQSQVITPMTATIDRLKADVTAEKDKRAKDVRKERQQKAEAKAKAEELETKLSGVRGEVETTFESRLENLENMWMREKEEREKSENVARLALAAEREERAKADEAAKHALKEEREERERALKEQGVAHAKREDELAQKLKDLSEALTCAVLRNDFIPLRTLQIRAALDDIQEMFAQHCLKVTYPDSLAWRMRLDECNRIQDRITLARSLMANTSRFQTVLDSDSAMIVICQRNSSIRSAGNIAAHSYADTVGDITALQAAIEQILTDPIERVGMSDIVSCLSKIHFPDPAVHIA